MGEIRGKRFSLYTILILGLVGLFLAALLTGVRATTSVRPDNVALAAWEATADGEGEFLAVLTEQADLSTASSLPTREARLRYVYDALRSTALRTQAPLRAELDAAGVDYRPYYVVNMLAVRGDRELLTRLVSRPEVARIAANPRVRQTLPEPRLGGVRPMEGQGVEWGVERVNADDVWALGHMGKGIVVAGQDTGYDWDHPALIEQYRGYSDTTTATHDYNWHDAIHSASNDCGADSPEPCDDHGHGTHTMGTIVGDDGADNQIGVAPGARWIGCRNMEEGVGSPATYAECFEFFLAPYPIGGDPMTDGDPSKAPHVINNSWTCPSYEGCDWDTLQDVVENVRAAGIVVVASAGNSGSSCGSVQDPPAIYEAAFSVGATGSSDAIASFSSRGPVTVDGSGRRKPDASAPGVGVRSSLPGGGYGSMSGTSMAGPHVAGTMALLWSAAPELTGDVEATERIITRTARPQTTNQACGGDSPESVPNNVYGWGIVDALAAVRDVSSKLELSKRASSDLVLSGTPLTYSLRVVNMGAATTTVTMTDVLPAHVRPTGVLTWGPISLASGGVWTETVVVTVQERYEGLLTNVLRAFDTEDVAYTTTTRALIPTVELTKQVALPTGLLVRSLSYTFRITNTTPATLSDIILTDTIPVSTAFAGASGDHAWAGDVVTWTVASLAPWETVSRTLEITVAHLPMGTRVINGDYGLRASELLTPVRGGPLETLIPWRYWLFPIFKNLNLAGRDDA